MTKRALPLLLLALLVSPGLADPGKDLKSRDVKDRLRAVGEIEDTGGKDAEKLLLDALKDRDWEVVERAAEALSVHGGPKAVRPLLNLTLLGPVRGIRLAAARSLLALDAEAAGAALVPQASGKMAQYACEALEVLAPAIEPKQLMEAVARGLQSKEAPVKVAAARLFACLSGGDRRRTLESLLGAPETSVRASALDAAREHPDPDDIPRIVQLLHEESLNDVLSRRGIAALVAIAATKEPGEEADRLGKKALAGYELAESSRVSARFARLSGLLAMARPGPVVEEKPTTVRIVSPDAVMPAVLHSLGHAGIDARSAAAQALGRIATETSLDRAAAVAKIDDLGRVRLHALRAVLDTRGIAHEGTRALAIDRLAEDGDVRVREAAAVALGAPGHDDVVSPLVKALGDEAWEVACCAAVSLGKTGSPEGVEPLRELAKHRDWKMRASALVGFGHQKLLETVPDIIANLDADTSAAQNTAYQFLRRMTTQDIPPQSKAWRAWWEEVKGSYSFPDLEKEAREAKRYGYAPTYRGVYEDLDVIVLQSRGDHIEQLLDRLSIRHRMTRQGQLVDAGIHPFAVFVSNCTGEIVGKDVEQLQWFVRTGGYLFCSCWALHYTLEPTYPGVVRKYETPGQVLENVRAQPCPTESPFLEGVFDGLTRPVYVLYGAHLIEVLDPERVEVLIDSPECADTWGEGNLACWFTAGHGVILDSSNHFDLQGLEKVDGLKGAEDRMAHAMDHMGLSYADLRELDAQKVWGSRAKAAAEARDLSAFRFITNFVRQKRRVDR